MTDNKPKRFRSNGWTHQVLSAFYHLSLENDDPAWPTPYQWIQVESFLRHKGLSPRKETLCYHTEFLVEHGYLVAEPTGYRLTSRGIWLGTLLKEEIRDLFSAQFQESYTREVTFACLKHYPKRAFCAAELSALLGISEDKIRNALSTLSIHTQVGTNIRGNTATIYCYSFPDPDRLFRHEEEEEDWCDADEESGEDRDSLLYGDIGEEILEDIRALEVTEKLKDAAEVSVETQEEPVYTLTLSPERFKEAEVQALLSGLTPTEYVERLIQMRAEGLRNFMADWIS